MPSSRPPDEKLTEFGRLYYVFCDELGLSGKEMERQAGLKSGTLSRNTRLSGPGISKHPRRETVIQLSAVMQTLARERGIPWGDERERHLLHAALHATSQDVAEAEAYYQVRRAATNQQGRRRRTQGKTPQDQSHDSRGISPLDSS